jgi:hypothetical protein
MQMKSYFQLLCLFCFMSLGASIELCAQSPGLAPELAMLSPDVIDRQLEQASLLMIAPKVDMIVLLVSSLAFTWVAIRNRAQ